LISQPLDVLLEIDNFPMAFRQHRQEHPAIALRFVPFAVDIQ
jgi:hypothetical protein